MLSLFCLASTSPLASPWSILAFRAFSLAVHVVVVALGLYTRFPVFFVQFTNWTNVLSLFYSALAFSNSLLFLLAATCVLPSSALRTKARLLSKLASAYIQLLKLSLPMHCLVTGVFWVLVNDRSIQRSGVDSAYIFMAHGVTLILMAVEAFLCRVQVTRASLRTQFAYVGSYAFFALVLLLKYNYPVYEFLDVRKSAVNRMLITLLPIGIVLSNWAIMAVGALRDRLIGSVRTLKWNCLSFWLGAKAGRWLMPGIALGKQRLLSCRVLNEESST